MPNVHELLFNFSRRVLKVIGLVFRKEKNMNSNKKMENKVVTRKVVCT